MADGGMISRRISMRMRTGRGDASDGKETKTGEPALQ